MTRDLDEFLDGIDEQEVEAEVAAQRERVKARKQTATLRALVSAQRQEIDTLERQLEVAMNIEDRSPTLEVGIDESSHSLVKPEACYVMLASDWHMGERVRPETVSGMNEYTPEIAKARAQQWLNSNHLLLNGNRTLWTINQAVLWLGGDLMSGYIHEELIEENYLSPIEESELVFDTFVSIIQAMLDRFDLERLVIPTSCGNHGRTGKEFKVSSFAKNNHEFLVYKMLEKWFADEPRVTFHVSESYHNVVPIFKTRVNFHHGHEVKYQGGVGGITVPLYRRIGRQAQGGLIYDLHCFGHHHTLGFPQWAVTNGSLIGPTAYGLGKGFAPEPPMQASFIIDSRWGLRSACNPVIVDPVAKAASRQLSLF